MKRLILGGGIASALVVAFLLGSLTLGLVGAQTPPTPTPQVTANDGPNREEQKPSYTGSIQVPNDTANKAKSEQPEAKEAKEADESKSEQDEANALAGLAKITADQAREAALAQFPGATVAKVKLDDENSSLVYNVQLTDASGKAQEVVVDAGNTKVLATQADESEQAEGHGSKEKSGRED